MKNIKTLSKRGQTAVHTQLRVDFDHFFEASNDMYHGIDNPNGKFPLNTAENKQSWHLLKEKMELIGLEKSIPDWVPNYTSCLGHESFRASMANFLSRFLTKCPINPDYLAVSVGASAVIEMTAWLLGDAKDVAVFPTPSYPVYKQDVGNKAGMERYDLITHHDISEIAQKPILKIKQLKKAKKDIEAQEKTFKLLVLTTPDNPTGGTYSIKRLEKIANWCIKNKIHLIVNEIYGLSQLDTNHPIIKKDYKKQRKFVSFGQIMHTKQSPYLHLWYALSKDLGISGFRVGLVHTFNEAFLKGYDNLNVSHLVSNHTQWILSEIINDHDFMEKYIQYNQQALTEAYVFMIEKLRALDIPYVPSRGSLFIWVDCSKFLKKQSQKAETKFWEDLYNKTGVLLTPGEGFGHSKRGLFRIVYPCFNRADLGVAMERFAEYIKKL